jgi:predicted RND superfamily exporter protein
LSARYLEERRAGDAEDALAAAIAATVRPTAVASLGASIAYGSLAATSFRGFADFAMIGAVGMALCWLATFGLLPALILRVGKRSPPRPDSAVLGSALVRLIGFRRPRRVVAILAALSAIALVIVVRFIAAGPFEYDLRRLGSADEDAVTERAWMKVSDQAFGRGLAGRTIIAADRIDQVPLIVDALRARNTGLAPGQQTIGAIESILDVVPADARDRLVVLDQLRRLLDDKALDALDERESAELREARPPDGLAAPTPGTLPASIRDGLTEKDGRIGYLIAIRPADALDELDGHDVIRFATAVSRLPLPTGETVTTSGASVIFANILETIEHDGPLVTSVAAAGLVVMIVLVVGRNRRAVAVLAATGVGALFMVAACAVLALRVTFLDFVALPITLGLGIDYAINIADRHDREGGADPIATLRSSGAAVFVCSLTTMIGYGSLLVSSNLAIRGFGMASLIGEVTSVLSALVLVPAVLALGTNRRRVAPTR